MSGLYNAMFGYSAYAPITLAALDIDVEQIERFRDAWIDWADDALTEPILVILTRTGQDPAANAFLRTLAGYRQDQPDPHDSSYATFLYDVPASWESIVRRVLHKVGKWPSLKDRFAAALATLDEGKRQ